MTHAVAQPIIGFGCATDIGKQKIRPDARDLLIDRLPLRYEFKAWDQMCIMAAKGEIDVIGFDVKTLSQATVKARKDLALVANLLGTLVRAGQ